MCSSYCSVRKKRFLRQNPSNPADYQVLADDPNKKIAYINLYGMGPCGPEGSLLDGNPIRKLAIATEMLGFDANLAFMLKAKGDSMLPKIKEGDLVIAKKSKDPLQGDIIVCVYRGKVLIKKFVKISGDIILESLNRDKFDPIVVDKHELQIEDVVKAVYAYASA